MKPRKVHVLELDPFADVPGLDPLATPEDVEARALLCQLRMPNPVCPSSAFYSQRYADAHAALCAGAEDAEGIDSWLAFDGRPVYSDTALWWGTLCRWYKADVRAVAELVEYARRRTERAKLMRAIAKLESW